MKLFLILILFVLALDNANSQVFYMHDPNQSHLDFVNIIQENKNMNVTLYEYMYNGAGVAVGDINNDGLQDLFFTSNLNQNELYLNKGNFRFEKITESAKLGGYSGWSTGAAMVDINNDGWLDIYVCKSAFKDSFKRVNQLYINNKDNTFSEKAREYGLADASYSNQAYFADFDRDGDLDLFLLNHPYKINEAKKVVLSYDKNGSLKAVESDEKKFVSNRYYSNENGFFKDKTEQVGLLSHSFGLSAVVADFNADGFLDIYTCNDYLRPDKLFVNNGKAVFEPKEDSFFSHFSYFSMGSDFEDINNDGYNDLMVLDMLPQDNYRQKQFKQMLSYDEFYKNEKYGLKAQFVKNVLQLNYHNKFFSDIAYAAHLSHTDWSWAPLIADFDNDGWKDMYISNGYYRDVSDMDVIKYKLDSFNKTFANIPNDIDLVDKQLSIFPTVQVPNYLFKNIGGLDFKDVSKTSGVAIPSWSNGAVYADLDNDGDLDIVTNNINQYALLLENKTPKSNNHFLRLKLKSKSADNAFGSRVEIYDQDTFLTSSHYYPTKGYLSTHEPIVHIGLGTHSHIDAKIIWPNQSVQWFYNIPVDSMHTIVQEKNAIDRNQTKLDVLPCFENVAAALNINYTQTENDYIDYKLEPLLYRQFSKLGPCIAVSDFDGDQLEDFFVGGAKDVSARIFKQQKNGFFDTIVLPVFELDKKYEDVYAQWIDIDMDNDKDLLVLSGGNDYGKNNSMYPARLYLNEGNGKLVKSKNTIFDSLNISAKSMAIADMDKDGIPDIFIGGYIVPGSFGKIPNSYFFQSKKESILKKNEPTVMKKMGMISAAQWIDVNQDQWLDLVVLGEWMQPTYYQNNKGILDTVAHTLVAQKGWWTSLAVADLNHDGLPDFVLGNYGINSRYQCSVSKPISMYVNDFDKNGSTDIFLTQFIGDTCYPVAQRDLLLDQMVFLKKRFYRYYMYATKTADQIFTKEEMKDAEQFQIQELKSKILLSSKDGAYKEIALPTEAQWFPIQAIQFDDINNDGWEDLLIMGNDYSAEIETGRMDAGKGLWILNLEGKQFKTNSSCELIIKGDVKTVQPIFVKGKKHFLVGKNLGKMEVLKYKD